jgi:hypothetical protein
MRQKGLTLVATYSQTRSDRRRNPAIIIHKVGIHPVEIVLHENVSERRRLRRPYLRRPSAAKVTTVEPERQLAVWQCAGIPSVPEILVPQVVALAATVGSHRPHVDQTARSVDNDVLGAVGGDAGAYPDLKRIGWVVYTNQYRYGAPLSG